MLELLISIMLAPMFAPGSMAAYIAHTISSHGYLSVIILMALESASLPIPSEVILPVTGYLVHKGVFDIYLAIIASMIVLRSPDGRLGTNVSCTSWRRGPAPAMKTGMSSRLPRHNATEKRSNRRKSPCAAATMTTTAEMVIPASWGSPR